VAAATLPQCSWQDRTDAINGIRPIFFPNKTFYNTAAVALSGLVSLIKQSSGFLDLADDVQTRRLTRTLGLPRAARPVVVAALAQQLQRPIVYITASVDDSRRMTDTLNALGTPAQRLPEPNTAFYDNVAPVREVIAQRSVVLAQLVIDDRRPTTDDRASLSIVSRPSSTDGSRSSVVVCSPRALMQPTLSAIDFRLNSRTLKRDQTLSLESVVAHWVEIGYESEQVVERIGAFSRRGGIIDIWSAAHALPIRIELFGNQIDSMRFFDPSTQRSGERIDEVQITPLERTDDRRPMTDDKHRSSVVGDQPSILDYLSSITLLIIDDEDELAASWESLENKAQREYETIARSTGEDADDDDFADDEPTEAAALTDNNKPYITWANFDAALKQRYNITLGQAIDEVALSTHPFASQFSPAPHFAGQLPPLMEYMQTQMTEDGRRKTDDPPASASGLPSTSIIVISRQSARLAEVWGEKHSKVSASTSLDEPPPGPLTFVVGALSEGFIFKKDETHAPFSTPHAQFSILTDAEIFGHVRPESLVRGRARKSAPERAFADWKPGDAVVHEDYGIGIFRGLMRLTVNTGTAVEPVEGEREYLLVEFADADRLYVPVHQLDRIARYIGGDDSPPVLDKLGSGGWTQSKQKARGAAADMARDLLKVYAEREMATRPSFGRDTAWQTELEQSFPYAETEDQLKAIDEVKADMLRNKPMDRLICGDVGFGKTEVALRAAFKAVQEQKQVAVLVPTTILAQQHWNTFTKRLSTYPLTIEMLSRFRTAKEKKEILEGLRDGSVDIVIGTHGLVANSVQFKDLGLLIIDEEQRFGIAAKERLKRLRSTVDVLTLTATPIPRTLYFGLSGIRDISRIETPPAERLPIISFVGAWDDIVVQQAIRRELDRDGQVFFVHNRVNSIELVRQKLMRLVPEAKLAVAHGQMEERQLARIMTNFIDKTYDVLLSTNIIESGVDIPNANTIIVDNADHFGLSELYQLRGRVGRSTIQAYAYFLHNRKARMTDEARERLETLREAAGIGAGYAIAMRDLELRGAGDILGPKQSGQIASVGFDLYTRLLSREVATLRALRDGTPMPSEEAKAVVIDLPISVGLPQNYIGDDQLRVQLYRRVASLDDEAKILAFEEELTDRFGNLPQPALNLTYQVRLKLVATKLGAQSITTDGNRFTIRAPSIEQMNRARLERLLGEDCIIGRTQVTYSRSGTPEQWKKRLFDIVTRLAEMKG